MSYKTGGPAFPVVFEHNECTSEQEGMTLRDYFAVRANDLDIAMQGAIMRKNGIELDSWRAKARYMHADEMLKARAL